MTDKKDLKFSRSKREFLKHTVLLTVYIGPAMKTFEMASVAAKPTGPPPKKTEPTSGTT